MANCHAGSNILYQPLEATYSLVQPCCRHRRGLCTGVTLVPKDRLDSRDRLILVQVKVKRAEKHLRGLAAEILALEHTTILTPDPNTGVAPHPISLLHPNNFQKAPTLSFDTVAIAGDVIHNLRSALEGWVLLGIHRGHELPVIEGVTLNEIHSDEPLVAV